MFDRELTKKLNFLILLFFNIEKLNFKKFNFFSLNFLAPKKVGITRISKKQYWPIKETKLDQTKTKVINKSNCAIFVIKLNKTGLLGEIGRHVRLKIWFF